MQHKYIIYSKQIPNKDFVWINLFALI